MKELIKTLGAIYAILVFFAMAYVFFTEKDNTAHALYSEPLKIISRQQWGANESYRYLKNNDQKASTGTVESDFYEKYKDELQYSRIVEYDENGDKYKWPLQYPEKVVKFVIHHSATTRNLDNPTQAIRDIYHHHAVNRGWGDIGYNYIVDLNGRVYEGRYGGEGVIGGHATRANHGSIGIMVLGNYEDSQVPEAVVTAVSRLIHEKSKIHGIVPDGMSTFRGEFIPNILGHRDVGSTRCPGHYIYERFPVIRTLAAKSFEEKEKFVKDYDYQNRSDVYYVELKPEGFSEVVMKLENIGNKDWGSETFLVVEENNEVSNIISFPTRDGSVLAKMQENVVKPGEIGTFRFTIESKDKGGTAQLRLVPVIDGTRKLTDYVFLPVAVQQPFYSYEYVDGDFPPASMEADTRFTVNLRIRNKGNVSWYRDGDRAVTLKEANGKFIAQLNEEVVKPGELGSFRFEYRSSLHGGSYKKILVPSVKNAGFNSSGEISFSTVVFAREYDAEVVSGNIMKNFERGASYNMSMKVKNVGSKDWNRNDLELFIMRKSDIGVGNLDMQPGTVKPGEEAEIFFRIQIDENAEKGANLVTARAKMNGEPLNLIPVVFRYSVNDKEVVSANKNGPKIRIKLGFEGDPEIASAGEFNIYSGEKHLRTMVGGEKAKVTREGEIYKVTVGTSSFTETAPIRFVPTVTDIIQIANYENRPAWNTSLNDNEFRGLIEVREEDGKLIAINELPLEDYLKGLGEVPNAEEPEKIKAVMTAARTYAMHYMLDDEKFPGRPYNLDDDPNVTQKYIGYGFEKRAPNVAKGVDATRGIVVTYDEKLIKTPYFNQSDGVRTKSAEEVWGWKTTPFLLSVADTYCDGDRFLGHGVGLSGCGAHGMAKAGYTFVQILTHYYTGIELRELY